MKKYLLIGLFILIGTNIVVLSGVAFNRMGTATSHLMLTERELTLPYNTGAQKENSGISLAINWRTPTGADERYYPYSSRDIKITKDELLTLGFEQVEAKDNYWIESKEIFWALEFNGALHKAEIEKAIVRYQSALAIFQEKPNDTNSRKKTEYKESLVKEKTTNSRLIFVEASAHYESLAAKFSDQQNILIVKGLAKPYYNRHDKVYSLKLRQLSVQNIMIPLEYAQVLSTLKRLDRRDSTLPRYAVDIFWGSRLEPWVVGVKRLTD